MNKTRLCLTLLALGLLCSGFVSGAESDALALVEQVRGAVLEPERSLAVANLEIDLGLATLQVESGHLIPARAIEGQTVEFVFVGQASFSIDAPDDVEAQQLAMFTGSRSLAAAVRSAILVIGDSELSAILIDRPRGAPLDEAAAKAADELFVNWVDGAERKGLGAAGGIFKAVAGDAAYRRYFATVLESEAHGRFYYLVDPGELEQVTLGQFVPLELDDLEAYRAERSIRRAKKRGRSLQTRLEHLGDWDTWLRSSLLGEDGKPRPGSPGFEPQHYEIEATLDTDDSSIQASATVTLRVEQSGRRAVVFELFADLVPSAVRDAAGNELLWFRSGSDLQVLLAEAPEKNSEIRIAVTYGGVILEKLEKGIFRLRSTHGWYPHAGTFDRATYDVTLHWPKSVNLLGSGQVMERTTNKGVNTEHRKMEMPAFAFTFEVGDFDIVREQVGHVALTVGFSKSSWPKDAGAKEEVLVTLRGALSFYEQKFGAYPLDYLTVATIPRNFSQGFISFLTLSHTLLALPNGYYIVPGSWTNDRQVQRWETVAHELAHQWWGNKVGWYNYRDQWLSEAMAEYSAVTYAATLNDRAAVYLLRHGGQWSSKLEATARDGRSVESHGPVVLGERLFSSKSNSAYTAIVYDKGAVVFNMMARMFGDDAFGQMLKALADAVANRAVDAEVFIQSLEHMSGADLSAFADRFIYGTGIPEVYYDYGVERTAQGWTIQGEARPVARTRYSYELVREDGSAWSVLRKRKKSLDLSSLAVVVPFQIELDSGETRDQVRDKRQTGYSTGRGLGGNVLIRGEPTPFTINVAEEPVAFHLDQGRRVLAHFYSESRAPKRSLRYRAMELGGAEGLELLQQALSVEFVSEHEREDRSWSEKQVRRFSRTEDARIQLEIALTHLDLGQYEAAQQALGEAEELFGSLDANRYRSLRDYLVCRIAVAGGDSKTAWKKLEGKLYLDLPRGDSVGSDIRRNKWKAGYRGDGDDYALLAASAFETGHEQIARLAAEEAEELGADMSVLTDLLGSTSASR